MLREARKTPANPPLLVSSIYVSGPIFIPLRRGLDAGTSYKVLCDYVNTYKVEQCHRSVLYRTSTVSKRLEINPKQENKIYIKRDTAAYRIEAVYLVKSFLYMNVAEFELQRPATHMILRHQNQFLSSFIGPLSPAKGGEGQNTG